MKKLFIAALTFVSFGIYAQQQEQYSLYMMNNYLMNPAEGGTEEFIDLKLGYRTQWVGLDDRGGAPKTAFLSGHAAVGKKSSRFDDVKQLPYHGVGGIISQDNIGVWSVLDVKGSYAYHLPVSKDLIVSFGTFIGVKNYQYDAGSAEFARDPNSGNGVNNDNAFSESASKLVPDLTLGVWAYSKQYYVGFSAFQLLGNTVDVTSVSTSTVQEADAEATLAQHYWLTGGYRFGLGSQFHLIPSFVVKGVAGAPIQFDVNAKLRYEDKYWVGVSYRNLDAAVILAGITIKGMIDVGYAYDFNISDLNPHNSGSHEIMIGLRVPNTKHEPAPAQFW